MLKRSLMTVAILGAFVAGAGAHSDQTVQDANRSQKPLPELALEAPPATCEADPIEAQSRASLERFLQQQTSSPLDEAEVEIAYAYRGGGRCLLCFFWGCIVVSC